MPLWLTRSLAPRQRVKMYIENGWREWNRRPWGERPLAFLIHVANFSTSTHLRLLQYNRLSQANGSHPHGQPSPPVPRKPCNESRTPSAASYAMPRNKSFLERLDTRCPFSIVPFALRLICRLSSLYTATIPRTQPHISTHTFKHKARVRSRLVTRYMSFIHYLHQNVSNYHHK